MSTLNATRCIGIGLLGLPLYGTLFFWSSFDGQPDPDTQLGAWSRFVSTDYYVYSHLLTALSLIYGQTISPARTPFTVPLGAVVVAISGGGWP